MSTVRPIGLTGSAASGKSTVAALLAEQLQATVFEADACVHRLLRSPEVVTRVAALFPECVADGVIVRARLRERVFAETSARRTLEALLHPAVYAACREEHARAQREGRLLIAEIPLLYETGAAADFHPIILVASSPEVQRQRLRARGLEEAMIEQIRAAQWTVERKLPLADKVVWNDGSLEHLRAQVRLLGEALAPGAGSGERT